MPSADDPSRIWQAWRSRLRPYGSRFGERYGGDRRASVKGDPYDGSEEENFSGFGPRAVLWTRAEDVA